MVRKVPGSVRCGMFKATTSLGVMVTRRLRCQSEHGNYENHRKGPNGPKACVPLADSG
jgi:hypothetical protein